VPMQEHLRRLYQGAKALDMHLDVTPAQLASMLYRCVDANGMRHASGVHVRLMVTRGLKPTPYQNPACIVGGPTIVMVPEWKQAAAAPAELVRAHSVVSAPSSEAPSSCVRNDSWPLPAHSVQLSLRLLNGTDPFPWRGQSQAGTTRRTCA
jgi:hypothetical protein